MPEGNSHWSEVNGRIPSSVLTCLLKNCHPGLIRYRGKVVVASTWKHYQVAKNTDGKSAAEFVEEGFWEKYKSKAMELNGPGFDWLHSPVDVRALYQCSCGMPATAVPPPLPPPPQPPTYGVSPSPSPSHGKLIGRI